VTTLLLLLTVILSLMRERMRSGWMNDLSLSMINGGDLPPATAAIIAFTLSLMLKRTDSAAVVAVEF